MDRVYADAAAATPLSKRSRDELVRLLEVYGNAGALHKEGVEAKNELEQARKTIASAISAHPDEIIFTASGTEGNNLAINGVLRPLLQQHGELHAITLSIEHQSVLEPLRALEADGLYTTEMPVNSEGLVSLEQLKETINDETVFISIQLVNSEVGTVEPVREIAKLVRHIRKERGLGKSPLNSPSEALTFSEPATPLPLYFHCDASQAPLWIEMKVDALGCDLITLDGQKVLGPKGVGALFVKRRTDIEPVTRGGVQEFGLRGGTPNVPLAAAFAVAFADAQKNVEERVQKVSAIRDFCFDEIKKRLPDAILNGPSIKLETTRSSRVANNLNISIPGLEAQMAVIALDAEGVAASTRSACTIGNDEPSHVIKALGVAPELAGTATRLTFLPSITKKEALFIAEALQRVAALYRQK
ncbi:MAG TPA: cysteine desulfurase family protein [Candidatus Paceibacterota bacterium]